MESVTCEDALYTIFWLEGLEALPIQGVTLTDISMARAGSVEEITYTSGLVATNIKVGGREVGVSA